MGITSATCGSILGSGKKVIGRRSCINYVKGFKVFVESYIQGGKNELGHMPKQWKLKLQNEISDFLCGVIEVPFFWDVTQLGL